MFHSKEVISKLSILFGIFLISVSLFIYQVVLTRVYSAVFLYHYVFLITSFAILGLGIGSILAYRIRRKNTPRSSSKKLSDTSAGPEQTKKKIQQGSMILTISFIAVFFLNYVIPFMNNLLVYTVIGMLPFIVGGYLYSTVFTEYTGISGKLYFADLVGSGAGSMAVIFLLNNAGMLRTIIVLCLIATIPAMLLPASQKKTKPATLLLAVLLIAGLFLPAQTVNNLEKNFTGILHNTDKTFGNIKKNGYDPEILFSEWNAFSRTDVIRISEEADEMVLTIDGSANAPMYRFDGNVESLAEFKKDTGYLPFSMGENNKVLLIGPGGGRDVLYALAGESREIDAVEINTSSIDAVKAFGAYNGSIYERPEVKVYGEDGRNFVRRSKQRYDLIFLSLVMTNTSQGAGYALSENYIYTKEAMKDYMDHLTENGKVAFLAHSENDLSKIVATAMQVLTDKGIPLKDTPQYISVFSKFVQTEHGSPHMHNPVIIIKNTPYLEEESKALLETAREGGNMPLYTPMIYEEGVLHHIRQAHVSMSDYLNAFKSDITPATDDSPYFYKYEKGVPPTLVLLLFVIIIGGLFLFLPFAAKSGNRKPATYFSLLGMAFMMIEIPLIQKFILYLGHPTLAFTYVLAALLVGGGIGGYLSNRGIFNRNVKGVFMPPVLAGIISISLIATLGFIFRSTADMDIAGRIAIASVIVIAQGFFMGMPFPRGLRLIGESGRGEIVPVLWGINGIASVIGSVISIMLSMIFGFFGALIAGAVIYFVVGFYHKL